MKKIRIRKCRSENYLIFLCVFHSFVHRFFSSPRVVYMIDASPLNELRIRAVNERLGIFEKNISTNPWYITTHAIWVRRAQQNIALRCVSTAKLNEQDRNGELLDADTNAVVAVLCTNTVSQTHAQLQTHTHTLTQGRNKSSSSSSLPPSVPQQ